MRIRRAAAVGAVAALALTTAACGSSDDGDAAQDSGPRTITIAYQKTSAFHQLDDLLQKVKPEFEKANPDVTVKLAPIEAEADQYYTKLALMNGSKDTAPDVIYEDTFQVMSDAAAGYLLPIDDYTAKWDDWSQFEDAAKNAGLGVDGKTYGVSMGTDTRGIFYNKDLFKKAGLPTDWQPTTWQEIIDAAQTIKDKLPDVTPMNIYAGKAGSEQTTMQGLEMLYYGSRDGADLYNTDQKKWVTGDQGMTDSLDFYKTVYDGGLAPSLDQALDANIGTKVFSELLPQGKLAIDIDGSWMPGGWISGENAWPEWEKTLGFAKMPTKDGSGDGFTSMSGGWLLSVGAQTKSPQTAFDFVAMATNKDSSLEYDTTNSQIAVRKDVAEDPKYLSYNPSFEFFSSLVPYTHFRPATPDYSQISSVIQTEVEAVASGQKSPEDAAKSYDEGLQKIVGKNNTVAAG
ncbi:extracellular solute-binding protein [Cellulomonas sp. PhB143]|uniref:extracellular solute-binding protein n=1 Tax=Cellulomonas sp. PhB143 TaxID=2485186 RepID=UPI000F9987CB|nr:extracellular solute-binding protein [Cellulomonas sp. PhB143]ROS73340.1 carbohydrate ABC transporter substrate-binding protein (CUT1 family) [Cellulomonas sp. PhB143]